jgi:hypothetical protein
MNVYSGRKEHTLKHGRLEFMLWPTESRPIRLGVRHPFGARAQIFLFHFFCRTLALLFVLGRHLWREDGAVICSTIRQWSESRRTQYISVIWDYWVLTRLHTRIKHGLNNFVLWRTEIGNSVLHHFHFNIIICLLLHDVCIYRAEEISRLLGYAM